MKSPNRKSALPIGKAPARLLPITIIPYLKQNGVPLSCHLSFCQNLFSTFLFALLQSSRSPLHYLVSFYQTMPFSSNAEPVAPRLMPLTSCNTIISRKTPKFSIYPQYPRITHVLYTVQLPEVPSALATLVFKQYP